MPSGTIMNEVFAPRIHKSNAGQIAEDAKASVDHCTQRLLILAAATPTPEEKEMLVRDVDELVSDIVSNSWREWAAEYVKDNNGLCIDELEPPCPQCGQVGFHKMSCDSNRTVT